MEQLHISDMNYELCRFTRLVSRSLNKRIIREFSEGREDSLVGRVILLLRENIWMKVKKTKTFHLLGLIKLNGNFLWKLFLEILFVEQTQSSLGEFIEIFLPISTCWANHSVAQRERCFFFLKWNDYVGFGKYWWVEMFYNLKSGITFKEESLLIFCISVY